MERQWDKDRARGFLAEDVQIQRGDSCDYGMMSSIESANEDGVNGVVVCWRGSRIGTPFLFPFQPFLPTVEGLAVSWAVRSQSR